MSAQLPVYPVEYEDGPFQNGYTLKGFFWMFEWNDMWEEVDEIQ